VEAEVVSIDHAVCRDLARAAAGLSKQVEVALGSVELSLSQYRVLSFLEEGSSESSALARRLAVRPPSVTSVVDGLVSRELVERHHSADDRRRVAHVLTDEGRRLLRVADRAVGDRLCSIATSLGDQAESTRATDGLVLWREAIVAYRQQEVRQ
jgi:DNA-binding MarR family transcriptional regulator